MIDTVFTIIKDTVRISEESSCLSDVTTIISVVCAVVSIIVSLIIANKSINFSKESKVKDRYFEQVLLYSLELKESSEEEMLPKINLLVKESSKEKIDKRNIRKICNDILSIFFAYKKNISSRLKLFDKEINSFFDEKEESMTAQINDTLHINKDSLEKSLKGIFDEIIQKLKELS